jgi:hypothetical protein
LATTLTTTEGLHYLKGHNMDGATVYMGLIFGQTIAGGNITSISTLAGLAEETSTGYARLATVLSADANGIQTVPSQTFQNLSNAWKTNETVCFIASALTVGVGLYYWDFQTGSGGAPPYDMSVLQSQIVTPIVSWFYENPGGI